MIREYGAYVRTRVDHSIIHVEILSGSVDGRNIWEPRLSFDTTSDDYAFTHAQNAANRLMGQYSNL